MAKCPSDSLHELAALFEQRNTLYGSTYIKHGAAIRSVFSNEVPSIESDIDAARFQIMNQIVGKLVRYANNWELGHADSLDDISVYSQMLKHLDALKKDGERKL